MVALLVDELSALIVEICQVNTVLARHKDVSLFPVMQGVDEHSLELIDSMIQPEDIPEIILINSAKINLIVKVMGSFNDIQHLLGQFIVILKSLDSSVDVVIVVILDDGIDFILVLLFLP
jgi:hypothetical protein